MPLSRSKKLVHAIARRFGFDIVRYPQYVPKIEPPVQNPFQVLEFVINDIISRGAPFFFVQIGANDGIRWDPLRDLVCRHHLRGLLVEPLPDVFAELKRNYAMETQLSFERAAIAMEDGFRSLFRVKTTAPVGDWAQGIASFSKSHLINHLRDEITECERFIEEEQVRTVSVATLLRKHTVTKISLLQIDTEGYDFEILKMFFAANILPDVVNFERVNLSLTDQQASRRLLIERGYRFVDVGMDTLAILASLSSSSPVP